MLCLALDWDDQQIRMVAGDRNARRLRLRAAVVRPIGEQGLQATIAELVDEYGLEKAECSVAIGRDRAELRQMNFPPVPSNELPDMVRFQAIRQFASAGENAAIDFITTHVDENGIKAIVAATGPQQLEPIRKTVESSGWTLKRVALRPIAAAALYRLKVQENGESGDFDADRDAASTSTIALIDLVGDEVEIVLLRAGEIVFVRSVRLPGSDSSSGGTSVARTHALAGEIRRSLIACGATGETCHVVMWGTADRHGETIKQLAERIGQQQEVECQTRLIDPLEWIGASSQQRAETGMKVGRLAPLVGLLVADTDDPSQLIDFINPRQTVQPKADHRKIAALIGIPTALIFVLLWMLWGNLSRLDGQIQRQAAANSELIEKTEISDRMIERTEQIDQFLDSDVNWLDELQRLAGSMPGAEELIVKEITAVSHSRDGGGRVVVSALVTSPEVIDQFEAALRDETHQVSGDKVTQLPTSDAYRWQMIETISIAPDAVRSKRYQRIRDLPERTLTAHALDANEVESGSGEDTVTPEEEAR